MSMITLFGFPQEYFTIVKMNKAVYMGSVNMIHKQISVQRSKLVKIEKQIEMIKMTPDSEDSYIVALDQKKEQYLKRIQKLEEKKVKIRRKTPSRKVKERLNNCIIFVTFGTTLQRDIFLSLHGNLFVPIVKMKERFSLVFPAPPVGNIDWRNIGYDPKTVTCQRSIAQTLANLIILALVYLMTPFLYFMKSYNSIGILGPLISILISRLINICRRKIALWNRALYIDLMNNSGVSFLVDVKKICAVSGLFATFYVIEDSSNSSDFDRSKIFCGLVLDLLAVKIFLVPLMSLLNPMDVLCWVRTMWTIHKYRKCPEKVPLMQKDLNMKFKRREAPLVTIFARMVYLSFVPLTFIPSSPLICILSLISLAVQCLVDKYLILRRYKKMPEILPLGKKFVIASQIRVLQIYILTTIWLAWGVVGFGFRWTLIEFIREIVLLLSVFWVKSTFLVPRSLIRYFYSLEVTKNGKFADFIKRLKHAAWGKHEGVFEGSKKYQEEMKILKEEILLKVREGRWGERGGVKGRALEETNMFGVNYDVLRKMIDEKISELKEDDYYENCELELREDFDRANPMTEYIAKQIFLKKKVMRIKKEVFEERNKVVEIDSELNIDETEEVEEKEYHQM